MSSIFDTVRGAYPTPPPVRHVASTTQASVLYGRISRTLARLWGSVVAALHAVPFLRDPYQAFVALFLALGTLLMAGLMALTYWYAHVDIDPPQPPQAPPVIGAGNPGPPGPPPGAAPTGPGNLLTPPDTPPQNPHNNNNDNTGGGGGDGSDDAASEDSGYDGDESSEGSIISPSSSPFHSSERSLSPPSHRSSETSSSSSRSSSPSSKPVHSVNGRRRSLSPIDHGNDADNQSSSEDDDNDDDDESVDSAGRQLLAELRATVTRSTMRAFPARVPTRLSPRSRRPPNRYGY